MKRFSLQSHKWSSNVSLTCLQANGRNLIAECDAGRVDVIASTRHIELCADIRVGVTGQIAQITDVFQRFKTQCGIMDSNHLTGLLFVQCLLDDLRLSAAAVGSRGAPQFDSPDFSALDVALYVLYVNVQVQAIVVGGAVQL